LIWAASTPRSSKTRRAGQPEVGGQDEQQAFGTGQILAASGGEAAGSQHRVEGFAVAVAVAVADRPVAVAGPPWRKLGRTYRCRWVLGKVPVSISGGDGA
jgi:hypothetical protein